MLNPRCSESHLPKFSSDSSTDLFLCIKEFEVMREWSHRFSNLRRKRFGSFWNPLQSLVDLPSEEILVRLRCGARLPPRSRLNGSTMGCRAGRWDHEKSVEAGGEEAEDPK